MSSIVKELHRLIRRVGKLTDGQASVCDLDWEEGDLESFRVEIRPNSGFYQGGTFNFRVYIPNEYFSDEPPTVHCETDIYHPNIDTTDSRYHTDDSNVCLDLLDRGTWNPKMGLEGVIIGLVFLMHNPNVADPLFDEFHDFFHEDFEENVKRYMRGEDVDGREFSADFLYNIRSKKTDGFCLDDAECELVGNKTSLEKSVEDVNTTDNGAMTSENQCDNQHGENMQPTTIHQINTNSESDIDTSGIHYSTDKNIQEKLLKQLEEKGCINDQTDTSDDNTYEGNTTITIDEELVLIPYDIVQLLQEELFKKQATDKISNFDSVADEQSESSQIAEQDNNRACISGSGTFFMSEKTNYEETNVCRINTETSLKEYWFTLQKSPESIESQARAFNYCAPYLKCILFHTNSLFWDLMISGRSFIGKSQRIGPLTEPLKVTGTSFGDVSLDTTVRQNKKDWILLKVHLPTDTDDVSTAICDGHTNITTTILQHVATNDNVSLSILDKSICGHKNNTEGVLIGLVYQMHNQQLTLYFDCDKQIQNLFKENLSNSLRIGYDGRFIASDTYDDKH